MPQRVPGGNTLTWLFGLGDLDKLEKRMNRDRMLRRCDQQLCEERLFAMPKRPKALHPRLPLYHPTLHMPGGPYPDPQDIEIIQAIQKVKAAGLNVPQYLLLAQSFASGHGGGRIGVDSWPPGAVDKTFTELFNQIAQVTDFFKDRPRRIDLATVPDEKKRKYIKKLFDCYEGGGRLVRARPRRHEPVDYDWYSPQGRRLRSDPRLRYEDISRPGKSAWFPPPSSPLAYDTDPYSDPSYSYDPNLSYDDYDDDPTYLPRSREASEDDLRYAFPQPRDHRIQRIR